MHIKSSHGVFTTTDPGTPVQGARPKQPIQQEREQRWLFLLLNHKPRRYRITPRRTRWNEMWRHANAENDDGVTWERSVIHSEEVRRHICYVAQNGAVLLLKQKWERKVMHILVRCLRQYQEALELNSIIPSSVLGPEGRLHRGENKERAERLGVGGGRGENDGNRLPATSSLVCTYF